MATGKLGNIVFYAQDPARLAAFWSEVFGYPPADPDGSFEAFLHSSGLTEDQVAKRAVAQDPTGEGPRFFFHHAIAPKAEDVRNRLHLDVSTTPGRTPTPEELAAERDRLVDLGATLVRLIDQDWGPFHEHYFQMRDPEGNEFCLQ